MFLFVAWSCALRASAAPTDLPEPYLALFTFQRAELGTITDDQLRILEASPFDGMAVWCLDCRSTETPPALAELGPRLEHLRNNTTKHVWPVAFLNRIIEQTPETTPPGQADPDPEFAKIRGLDLDDEAGALSAFLLSWRLSLQIARELGAPGVCLDPEFYNDHALENIARLAQRRGERDSETLAKLRAVGARMADIVGEEYPGAVVWTLFTRLCGPSGWINGAPGHLLKAFLDRANETSIPLALVDGAEESTSIGYVNPSLVALEEKIDAYESRYQGLLEQYPQLLLGGTIAPWLDTQHRASWMTEPPAVDAIEQFDPYFSLLLERLDFVWIYAAGDAYNVWQDSYATRFAPVLRSAKARASGTRQPGANRQDAMGGSRGE